MVGYIQLRADEAYVEDTENPVEVQPPSADRFLIVFCVQQSRDWIPPALFNDLLLDLRHGSMTKTVVSKSYNARITVNVRPQLINRFTHGLVQVVHPLSVHPSVKSGADICTSQSKLDIIRLVEHRILHTHQTAIYQREDENVP